MDQTYGFFGFIIYLLSFLGCGDTAYRPTPNEETQELIIEESLTHEKEYNLSLEQWEKEKKIHHDSYQYTLFFENSMETFSSSTIVFVKNGLIYARKKEAFLYNSETNQLEPYKKETWTESKEDLGTHDEFPKTMDELYKDCRQSLSVDPNNNNIIFRTDNNELLSVCGHIHEACADDCFKGVKIKDFKWLQ